MFRERMQEIRRLNAQRGKPAEPDEPVRVVSDIDLFKRIKGLQYVPKSKQN